MNLFSWRVLCAAIFMVANYTYMIAFVLVVYAGRGDLSNSFSLIGVLLLLLLFFCVVFGFELFKYKRVFCLCCMHRFVISTYVKKRSIFLHENKTHAKSINDCHSATIGEPTTHSISDWSHRHYSTQMYRFDSILIGFVRCYILITRPQSSSVISKGRFVSA